MGNDDGRAVSHDFVESSLHEKLRFFVESASCFIEEKNARLANDSPGNRNSLLLATGQLAAAVSCKDIEALVEFQTKQRRISLCSSVNQIDDFFELAFILLFLYENSHTLDNLIVLFHANNLIQRLLIFRIIGRFLLHSLANFRGIPLFLQCILDLFQHNFLVLDKGGQELNRIVTKRLGQVCFSISDELESVSFRSSFQDFTVRCIKTAIKDVFFERVVEKQGLLLDEAKLLAQLSNIHGSNIDTID